MNFPVLFRHKRPDLPLTFNNQPSRHGLYSSCGQPSGDLRPQQRRNHVAHHPIEKAPGLLCINPILIQLRGVIEGFSDRFFGNLVEYNSLVTGVIATNRLAQMPGNRLPLSVEVSCQNYCVAVRRRLLQITDNFFLAGQHMVIGLPAILGVNSHPSNQLITRIFLFKGRFLIRVHFAGFCRLGRPGLGVSCGVVAASGRQVTNMAHTGLHNVVRAQVFIDGFRLCG